MPFCPPIICPPQCCERNCFIPRVVPVIHPVVFTNRIIIVNVPRHFFCPTTNNVIVDPGCPCGDP
jgi:spore coat protein D